MRILEVAGSNNPITESSIAKPLSLAEPLLNSGEPTSCSYLVNIDVTHLRATASLFGATSNSHFPVIAIVAYRSRRRLISQHLCRLLVQLFVLLLGDEVDQLLHDRVGLHPFGLGVEIGDDAVAQHRDRDL